MNIALRSTIFIFILALLTSCATTQSLSPQDKQQLHTISVNEKIIYPPIVYYFAPGVDFLMLGGLAGSIIASGIDANEGTQLAQVAMKNHVYINEIVKQQLASAINTKTNLIVVKQNADADLKITIIQYGFSVPTSFNLNLVPVLAVNAELIKNNKVIWKNHYNVNVFEGMKSYSGKEIFNNPEKMRTSWTEAAHKAAEMIVKTLN